MFRYFVSFLFVIVFIVACGGNDPMAKQQDQRSAVGPKLQGTWVTGCENQQISRLVFVNDRITVERVTFFDPECQEAQRTTRQAGSFQLTSSYKESIPNAIIFTLDPEVRMTFHAEYDVDVQNNNLIFVRNQKESEIKPVLSPSEKKNIIRANARIRAAKELGDWKKDEEKALNRLQVEKINEFGNIIRPFTEFGTRRSVRYELDNGFLQLLGSEEFGRVYINTVK
ncbi:MAG: hypothetical protein HY537_03890 [Deltaproteobacteria bacterium]|nr:hypothetical protein [Deltaproteobacteria bacterium]